MGRSEYQFKRYMYVAIFVFYAVFAAYLYPFMRGEIAGFSLFQNFLLFFAAPIGSLLGIYLVEEEHRGLINIRDRSIRQDVDSRIDFVGRTLGVETHYYPAINVSIMPIFSFGAVINVPTVICSILFSAVFFVAVWGLPLIAALPVLLALSLLLSWLVNIVVSIPLFIKISRSKPDGYVDIQYTEKAARAFIRRQPFIYREVIDSFSEKEKDLLKYLLDEAMRAAYRINNILKRGDAEPALLAGEVKTLEYIINDFIPKILITTRDYFKKHKAEADAALTVYEREVAPKVRHEALALVAKLEEVNDSIYAINKKVKQVEAQKMAEIEQQIEQSISLDSMLAKITDNNIAIPVIAFPEFHTLHFKDDAKRAAANNIVSGALQDFVEAKSAATNPQDKHKLEREIKEIKTFVKALASDTPESAAREARLLKKEQKDPLYINGTRERINDIDNMIAGNKYYINAYDETLPINKD